MARARARRIFSKIPPQAWLYIAGGIAAWFAWDKLKDLLGSARDAGKQAGEKASEALFDLLNPSLRAENYNKPTIVTPGPGNTCPKGYTLKHGNAAGWYCLRND